MQLSDFRFDLPEELIAQVPLAQRSASRLLQLRAGEITHHTIRELPMLLREGDHLVFNDTRVIPARLTGHKDTGGRVEVLLERLLDDTRILAQVRASKSPKPGTHLMLGPVRVVVRARHDDLFELEWMADTGATGGADAPTGFMDLFERFGALPLPPYIRRQPDAADRERYQTVFAREPGAVAAPTAGLHFDAVLLEALAQRGITSGRITLHVGAGTFQPVRVDDIAAHRMHAERVTVSAETVQGIESARQRGGRIIAVGTTCVRALESAAAGGTLAPMQGETRLFLTPGCEFRVVDGLVTNFHLPESTLLMLVCAFAGTDAVLAAYREAVAERYRFFSYGDAMLMWRQA